MVHYGKIEAVRKPGHTFLLVLGAHELTYPRGSITEANRLVAHLVAKQLQPNSKVATKNFAPVLAFARGGTSLNVPRGCSEVTAAIRDYGTRRRALLSELARGTMDSVKVFAKRFWGFDPANWRVVSFGLDGNRDTLLRASRPGDLVLFIGTDTEDTAPQIEDVCWGLQSSRGTKLSRALCSTSRPWHLTRSTSMVGSDGPGVTDGSCLAICATSARQGSPARSTSVSGRPCRRIARFRDEAEGVSCPNTAEVEVLKNPQIEHLRQLNDALRTLARLQDQTHDLDWHHWQRC